MATVVLVHGAWHGAWCWERVLDGLGARSVTAVAVDLPGHGEDPGPLTDLPGDAARVRGVLDDLDGPAVLVGHSYGGAVVTEAGDHPAAAHVVFLAALALDAGESCMSLAVQVAQTEDLGWGEGPHLAQGMVGAPDGTVALDPAVAAACLYNDCDDATVAWALARLGPHPLHNLEQQPHAVSWRAKDSTYVLCGDDLAVPPRLQRVVSRRCSSVLEWPTGHSPFLSRPGLVVDLLGTLASRTGP